MGTLVQSERSAAIDEQHSLVKAFIEEALEVIILWFKIHEDQVELHIFAKPNAKKTSLVIINEQGINIALRAKPQQDKANKELITFLAKVLRLSKSQVMLKRGEHSRYKTIVVPLTKVVRKFLDDQREQAEPKS